MHGYKKSLYIVRNNRCDARGAHNESIREARVHSIPHIGVCSRLELISVHLCLFLIVIIIGLVALLDVLELRT